MRGYLTFILALAAFAIFLHLSAMPREVSLHKALAVEKVYQEQQNAKELILEAVRSGAEEGLQQYAAEALVSKHFDRREAEERAKEEAFRRLILLTQQNTERVQVWCGGIDYGQTEEMLDSMQARERAEHCSGCRELNECREFIQIEMDSTATGGEIGLYDAGAFGKTAVGISVYDDDYKIGSIAYIPGSERRRFGIDAGAGNP